MGKIINFKVAIAQAYIQNACDQDTLTKNANEIINKYKSGSEQNCDAVVAPELTIGGYALGDLMSRSDVQERVQNSEDQIVKSIENFSGQKNTRLVFGSFTTIKKINEIDPEISIDLFESYNALQINNSFLVNYVRVFEPFSELSNSKYAFKKCLPNWSVFDEVRWFAPAKEASEPIDINGVKVGICICRDIWIEKSTRDLVEKGAQIIFVPNASPYANGRHSERIKVVSAYAKKYNIPIIYVNMVSGSDEVIFDGGSFAVNNKGEIQIELKRFEEDFGIVEFEIDAENLPSIPANSFGDEQVDVSSANVDEVFIPSETYNACLLGLREFINSIGDGQQHVVIGLSGGIDSALAATLAVDAFGSDRVHGVLMPSKYTSDESNILAEKLASNLGISCESISIEKLHATASDIFDLNSKESIVSENIQSRLRGLTLMMLSNSRGWLPIATGNKSEIAVGYCTLYGDTVGAFAPIKDVYKTQVFQLCDFRNSSSDFLVVSPILDDIINRPPTAELRENQKDSDSLPEYDVLDPIIIAFVEEEKSQEEIVALGYSSSDVKQIIKLIQNAEFKRRQGPTGTRLTRHNFGLGRRIPISSKY